VSLYAVCAPASYDEGQRKTVSSVPDPAGAGSGDALARATFFIKAATCCRKKFQRSGARNHRALQLKRFGAHAGNILLLSLLCPGISVGSQLWHDASDIRIYQSSTLDAAAPAVRAELLFDAPPQLVHQIITDYDRFAQFVPAVALSRTVGCARNVCWVHQRLDLPAPLAPREYLLEVTDRLHPGQGIYARIGWTSLPSTAAGLVATDVVVPRFSGYWVLRPVQGGRATAATYGVSFDPGGELPGWLIKPAFDRYAQSVIDALRKRISQATSGPESRAHGSGSAGSVDRGTSLASLRAVHIAAAPRYHFAKRNDVLRRLLPGRSIR
jgi:uncharacterized protein YndB with AHSA1/START domain